ncbi:MAG TPA: hypothetical protein VF182_11000 [Candidatus Binatia bacterium]
MLLVLIGREWIKMTDKSGVPRLENPEDFVRLEILAGLEQKTVIVPVLLADAEMPSAQALPAPLQPFARRNAIEISDSRFHSDVDRLIEAIEKIFNPQRAAVPPIRPEQRNQSSTPFSSASLRPNTGFIAAAIAAVALIVAGIWWFTTGAEQETSFQAEPYIQSPAPKSAENSPRQDTRQSPEQQSPRQSPVQQDPSQTSPAYNPRQSAPRN